MTSDLNAARQCISRIMSDVVALHDLKDKLELTEHNAVLFENALLRIELIADRYMVDCIEKLLCTQRDEVTSK